MSGETAKQESGWTVDTLKQHFDELREADQTALKAALASAEKAVAAALAASKEAVNKSELSNTKLFEAANQVKATFGDELNKKVDRSEFLTSNESRDDKIVSVTSRVAAVENRSDGMKAGWGYLVGAIGLAATVVGIILAFNN